ncbi:low molecular weight protein arginine phosphatase [Alkaliphilus hydrothermalis]|uniref:Protein-tyrosine-phosphatase n=1 Tax=Alkaliphilus hydrothermalis TaxID=1482730 RepID=A0ABS2NRB1_9FIRM|nr:low molecular weight protein arginine phosphatase [Alkaliphilus hydrothermalis]MBM7615114.1 protein-tyrosine-phosphatase [Alkaliphilus hydrothermalis]
MKKILLVCTGNTCRSSMAEAILKQLINDRKEVFGDIEISSAGTYAMEGGKASPQAIVVMEEWGLSLEEHRSTPITKKLVEEADLILTMTMNHKRALLYMLPDAEEKVFTLKEFTEEEIPIDMRASLDISDPFGQPVEVYRNCAEEIKECLLKLLVKLKKN